MSKQAAAPARRSAGRRLLTIVAALVLLGAGFVGGRMTAGVKTLPPLAATLPGDETDFSRELDDRVQERFPVGSDDKALIAELAAERFVPEFRHGNDANASVFVWTGLLCTKIVRVTWRADSSGVLTQVKGSYESKCQ
ncbi:MAG: hypothetical protein E7774_01320 [Bradyrhizobium sp.]|nr:MAG: hypothetical protein E7774_01320 [Bradyrhizobium sp.]